MKIMYNRFLVVIFFVVCSLHALEAKIILPSVYGDHMVLQQKSNVKIWGKSNSAQQHLTITTSWDKKTYRCVIDADGSWYTFLSTPSYGGPYTITLDDGELLTINDILIGEVWFCSGQSNMEMSLTGFGGIDQYEKEIREADYPDIRMLQVQKYTSNISLDTASVEWGGWTPASPETASKFSATAYFFAREIYRKKGIPIGLIHSSWGGTIIEAWMARDVMSKFSDFDAALKKLDSASPEEDFQIELKKWNDLLTEKDLGAEFDGIGWLSKEVKGEETWQDIMLPNYFDRTVFPRIDGIVYFRKHVHIPEHWVGKKLTLSLGPIDDNDITYINGVQVGATNGFSIDRVYEVPANAVRDRNVSIAIRVFDGRGEGGIYGDAEKLKLMGPDREEMSLAGSWKCQLGLDLQDMPNEPAPYDGPNRPTVLYNAMVNPFVDFKIRGVIWYQGESNAERATAYRELFPAMITNWRNKWNDQKMPFYYVQLANFMQKDDEPQPSHWAELRDAQLNTLSLPHVGMAVIGDIGDANDIHPKNKQDVGKRLAMIALNNIYKQKTAYSGPRLKKWITKNQEIILNFDPQGGKLVNKLGGDLLKGFIIAGDDGVFHHAEAHLKGNNIIVKSKHVSKPVAVRYGWANNPDLSLYNDAGLPASPFRTDQWFGK